MSNRFVLFICGGKWQLPWLLYIKGKGHRIILVDPYLSSPCVPEADIHILCDAKDVETIQRIVFERGYEIEFVTSDQTDVSSLTVARLSSQLGLRGNRPEVVELFSNKFKNRMFLQSNYDSHFPHFIRAFRAEDVYLFYNSAGGDLIMKPADAQSSRGVFKIERDNLHLIEQMFLESISYSAQKYLVVEKFLVGKEVTVEGICINNNHCILAVSDKKHFRTGIASELKYPAELKKDLWERLCKFHNDFIRKTGLEFGITHSEYIISPDESDFWLVEAACRGGGSLIPSHIVPWVSGFDVYGTFYKLVTGVEVTMDYIPAGRSAILQFFEFGLGKVKRIQGLDEARNIEGVIGVELEFEEGELITTASDDRSRQGYAIIFAETNQELEVRVGRVMDVVHVTIE